MSSASKSSRALSSSQLALLPDDGQLVPVTCWRQYRQTASMAARATSSTAAASCSTKAVVATTSGASSSNTTWASALDPQSAGKAAEEAKPPALGQVPGNAGSTAIVHVQERRHCRHEWSVGARCVGVRRVPSSSPRLRSACSAVLLPLGPARSPASSSATSPAKRAALKMNCRPSSPSQPPRGRVAYDERASLRPSRSCLPTSHPTLDNP
jgi:hypothetical protein